MKENGTAGGAAVAAGVDFQERVAAYAIAHAAVGMTDLSAFNLSPEFALQSVHLETAQSIDDIQLVGKSESALIQAKRSINLSDKPDSEFGSVIKQFVFQYFQKPKEHEYYLLATSRRSSDRILRELKKLTESLRLNQVSSAENPLTKAEVDVQKKTRSLICHFGKEVTGDQLEGSVIDSIFRRIHILILDIEEGERDEHSAKLLLAGRSLISPDLLWTVLLKLTSTLAKDRLSIDLKGLSERVGKYIKKVGNDIPDRQEAFKFEIELRGGFSAGREVLLMENFLDANSIAILELIRFGEDGARRVSFSRNSCRFLDGSEHVVRYRASTFQGIERYIDSGKADFLDKKVVLIPINGEKNYDKEPSSVAHSQYCATMFAENKKFMHCLHCGDPVSEPSPLVIEVDEDQIANAVGLIHTTCHRPTDRILGVLQSDWFSAHAALKNFDHEQWFKSARHGEGLIYGLTETAGVAHALWQVAEPCIGRGMWCLRTDLSDHSAVYVTRRGKVERFGEVEAKTRAAELGEGYSDALRKKDPWCVDEHRNIFAPFSALMKQIKRGEKCLRCEAVSAVPYTAAIDDAYSSKAGYYTPLAVLQDAKTGNPLLFQNSIPLISNPFVMAGYLDNWKHAGFEVADYTVAILPNDEAFDVFMVKFRASVRTIWIDPMFDTAGTLQKGVLVGEFNEFLHAQREN